MKGWTFLDFRMLGTRRLVALAAMALSLAETLLENWYLLLPLFSALLQVALGLQISSSSHSWFPQNYRFLASIDENICLFVSTTCLDHVEERLIVAALCPCVYLEDSH